MLRNLPRLGRWVRTDYLDIYQQCTKDLCSPPLRLVGGSTSLLETAKQLEAPICVLRKSNDVFWVWSHHVWHSIDCEQFTSFSTPVFTDLSCLIPIPNVAYCCFNNSTFVNWRKQPQRSLQIHRRSVSELSRWRFGQRVQLHSNLVRAKISSKSNDCTDCHTADTACPPTYKPFQPSIACETLTAMTARRPPRISDYNNEVQLGDSDSTPENDNQTRSNLSSHLTGSPVKALSPYPSTAVHPLLTDFGPVSASQYFREALDKLRAESLNKGKGNERAASPMRAQPRCRIPQSTRRKHKTVFDDDDSEDEPDEILATGDEASMLTDSRGLDRFKTGAWSEDEDVELSVSRIRGRRGLFRARSRGNSYGDLFAQPPSRKNPTFTAQPLDSPLLASTVQPCASRLSNTSAFSQPSEDHDIMPSIEDPATNDVPAPGNASCDCEILCLCGANQPRSDLPLESPLQPTKRRTRSNPAKSWLGKPRGSPSKNKALAFVSGRLSAAASAPTGASADLKSRKPTRAQDFEEHASEKRKSWRPGGEEDVSDDDSDLSEAGSTSYLSASGGVRHRQPEGQPHFRSAAAGNLVGNPSPQIKSSQPLHVAASTTQSIAEALDGINAEISADLYNNSNRPLARRAASTRNQEVRTRALSAHGDEENLLSTHLLFEDSEDEDTQILDLRRRIRLSRSLFRSPPRRRALRSFQHNNSAIGIENIPSDSFSPRHRVSSSVTRSSIAQRPSLNAPPASMSFDYGALIPQQLPKDILPRHSDTQYHAGKRQKATPRSMEDPIIPRNNGFGRADKINNANAAMAVAMSKFPALDRELSHPLRTRDLSPLQSSPNDPPDCPLGLDGRGWPNDLPIDIIIMITRYLSHQDVRSLRLVNSTFESILAPVIFRNVVTKFGKSMFDVNLGNWERKPPEGSIFEKYGMEIHKFGISFEVDLEGLQSAKPKVIQNTQSSWWGKYTWPVPVYPRFKPLEKLENLADHLHLLRGAFKNLKNVSELALCVDSGHGWLNGPDMSDLAVWKFRCSQGHKVFSKTFQAEDKWHQYGRNELFKWAQINSINEAIKSMSYNSHMDQSIPESQFLKSVAIRDFDSYAVESEQPDADPERHTGGTVPQMNPNPFNAQHQQMFQQAGVPAPNWVWGAPPLVLNHMNIVPNPANVHLINHVTMRGVYDSRGRQHPRGRIKKGEVTQPQWPIIYNGYNVTAETGGHCTFVQNKLADPRVFPIQPGHLTEAQAQWLMETVWAQRAFLSAYTTAILTHKENFKHVHSLHIAKISSGLLPSLEQRELWQALPNLRTLKVLVSPDWRTEYTPGDQSFQSSMLISPVQASIKFADFLHRYVSRIEHLSTLTIGFVGGGEHATGLLARNQHVLPAPVTSDPRSWLTDHVTKANLNTMIAFNHIKNLTIENAWLSPFMLEGFMKKSKDTSLRRLTLDSVSLTSVNSQRTNTPMTTLEDGLKPEYPPAAWLQERLPTEHCWPAVIDRLTPGVTFSQLRYDAGLIDPIQVPPPEPTFRGNVEKLTFKSCGYVKISGIPQSDFNQNGLVMPNTSPRDHGLTARETLLRESRSLGEMYGNATASVMMREKDSQGHEWFGLGRLTQCIHPIEKRVLEEAWHMTFGWGNDVERFGAVEDGCFEGGTGRFSGVVTK